MPRVEAQVTCSARVLARHTLPRDPIVTVWWLSFCELLRLVHRCGRVSLLKDLIGDIMSLCGSAQVGELIGHDAAFRSPQFPRLVTP